MFELINDNVLMCGALIVAIVSFIYVTIVGHAVRKHNYALSLVYGVTAAVLFVTAALVMHQILH